MGRHPGKTNSDHGDPLVWLNYNQEGFAPS